ARGELPHGRNALRHEAEDNASACDPSVTQALAARSRTSSVIAASARPPLRPYALAGVGVRADQRHDQEEREGNRQVDSATRAEANTFMRPPSGSDLVDRPDCVC